MNSIKILVLRNGLRLACMPDLRHFLQRCEDQDRYLLQLPVGSYDTDTLSPSHDCGRRIALEHHANLLCSRWSQSTLHGIVTRQVMNLFCKVMLVARRQVARTFHVVFQIIRITMVRSKRLKMSLSTSLDLTAIPKMGIRARG